MRSAAATLSAAALAACAGSGGSAYTLAEGDTLRSLAKRHYGDEQRWPAIWLGTNTQALARADLDVLVDPEAVGAGARVWLPESSEATRLQATWSTPGAFVETKCWKAVEAYGAATCGYVVVPEDHDDAGNRRTVQIALAVVKSTSASPAEDPVFVLEGGPGVSGVLTLYSDRILQFRQKRDVVLLDQRGMGHSQPGLFCKDSESTSDCKRRLTGLGIDLAKFHTVAIAEDVEAVRRALSLGQVNLFSFSYGTFLAQEILRRHPSSVRSAILDSCLPVSVATTAGAGQGAMAAFRTMAADCASTPDCSAAYPNLESTLAALLDQASSTPLVVTVGGASMTLAPAMLVTMLFNALNSPEQMGSVPEAIDALAKGRTIDEAVSKVLASTGEQKDYLDAKGAKISVQCHDALAFETYADAQAANADLNPYVAQSYNAFAKANHDYCDLWQIPHAEASFREPVTSDVPALILGGEYDSLTRPEWSQTVARTLARGHSYLVPRTGHVAIQRDCPLAMVHAFLADPSTAPDSSCLAGMKQAGFFSVP